MPGYARPLEQAGKVTARYHIVGAHGGAWLYDVGSNGPPLRAQPGRPA
jgi:hypothetical protein